MNTLFKILNPCWFYKWGCLIPSKKWLDYDSKVDKITKILISPTLIVLDFQSSLFFTIILYLPSLNVLSLFFLVFFILEWCPSILDEGKFLISFFLLFLVHVQYIIHYIWGADRLSHKGNHVIINLLYLSYFVYHDGFKMHPFLLQMTQVYSIYGIVSCIWLSHF